jgi:hypothetical protein
MMKKEIFFTLSMVFVVNSSFGTEQLDKEHSNEVFEKTGEQIYAEPKKVKEPKICRGKKVGGNDVWDFIYLNGYQENNPSPEFGKITVVKVKKGGKYDTQFQLQDIRKALDKGPGGRTDQDNKKLDQWDTLLRQFKAHNAIECPDLIQLLNKDDELKDVTVVIYGTQNTKHCPLYKEFLEQQKQEKEMESLMVQIDQQQQ